MAFTEDLDVFFSTAGFGLSVTSGATTAVGILDMPSEIIADGVVLTTDYKLLVKTSDFPSLARGSAITVDGTNYTVREPMLIDDGKITQVFLMKD
jgi:hypothetical protein